MVSVYGKFVQNKNRGAQVIFIRDVFVLGNLYICKFMFQIFASSDDRSRVLDHVLVSTLVKISNAVSKKQCFRHMNPVVVVCV